MPILTQDLSFTYPGTFGESGLPVLVEVNLSIADGEFVSILGPSGCGKTTLLKLLSGLLHPSSGYISSSVSQKRTHGFVFQQPNLLPWMNTRRNIELPILLQESSSLHRADVDEILHAVQLSSYEHYYPWQLSVGMQMRVNLARALLSSPEILLLDEPFAALDAVTSLQLQSDVLRLSQELKMTCVHVTHNLAEACALADRVLLLSSRPATVIKEYNLPARDQRHQPRLTVPNNISASILRDMKSISAGVTSQE